MGASSNQKKSNKKAKAKISKTKIRFKKPKTGKKIVPKKQGSAAFGAGSGKRRTAAVKAKLRRKPKIKK